MVLHHHDTSCFAAGGFDTTTIDPSPSSAQLPMLSIPIRNNNNLQYYGSVKIGSEGKNFNLVFDTGSDKLWVPSIECTSSVCKAHHRLDSSTFRPDMTHSSLSYGTGQVNTKNGFDSLVLSGKINSSPSSSPPHNVVSSSFGNHSTAAHHDEYPVSVATSMTTKPFVSLRDIDGIFGMSQSAKFSHQHPLYSMYLSNDTNKEGQLNVGGVNIERSANGTDQPSSWHPTSTPDTWSLDLVDIKVGDERLGLCSPDDPCTGLIDSGSSMITGPPSDVGKLLEKIHPTCGASKDNTSPPVTLIFKNEAGREIEYPLTSRDYTIDFRDTGECQTAIGPLNMGHKRWVIGDTFLRRYMGVFDQNHHRVGFLKSKHDNEDIGVVTRDCGGDQLLLATQRTERIRRIGNYFLSN